MAHLFQLKYKVRGEAMKNPGEGIVRIAEEEKAEMIIMGTRGLGKVRWLTQFSFKTICMKNEAPPIGAQSGSRIYQSQNFLTLLLTWNLHFQGWGGGGVGRG